MSDHDEVIERLDWLVSAVKHLLAQQPALSQPVAMLDEYENGDDDEAELAEQLDEVQAAQPVVPVCTHPNQAYVRGVIRCADCGHPLQQSGVIGRDPGASQADWARNARNQGA